MLQKEKTSLIFTPRLAHAHVVTTNGYLSKTLYEVDACVGTTVIIPLKSL
jgi:hypothetical protein